METGSAGATPGPDVVAARLVTGDLDEALVPLWAAGWLVDGHDGSAVVTLAGLTGTDPFEVRDALGPALAELGVPVPPFSHAWRLVATDQAERCLAGRLDEFELAAWAYSRYIDSGYDADVIAEPVGDTCGLDDEHIGGWGRTDDELRAAVQSACRAQIRRRPDGQPLPE